MTRNDKGIYNGQCRFTERALETEDLKRPKRSLAQIAEEIDHDWDRVNYAARPYLEAMREMGDVSDNYMHDTGATIVIRFLCNAASWRGETARRVKAELKEMLK
jgi:hypothetical protein